MSTTAEETSHLAERLAELERQFTELRDEVLGLKAVKKDWRSTVGMIPDDEISRSAFRLGAEWRRQQTEP